MAIQEHQNGEEVQQTPQDIAEPTNLVDTSRRSFTKSGLVASGVLLTLASRPVLGGGSSGGGWECKSPSGFLSGNLSQHGTPITCQGRTPGYWGTNTDTSHPWPSPYKTGKCINTGKTQYYKSWSTTNSTMFKDSSLGFNCSYSKSSIYAKYSMMQVILLGGSGDPYQLGAHCVAALLNARMGWTPVLTEAQVRNIFNEYASKGYFEPAAGVKWYPADIVAYLKSTMTL